MGCGSSSAAGASKPGARDPEDYYLEHLEFKKLELESFDGYLAKMEEPVNTVIDISNDVNDCIDDIRDAMAAVVGALRIELDTSIVSHDAVFITLAKADGSAASRAELKEVFAKASVKAADTALTAAVNAVHAGKPSDLALEGDNLAGAGAGAFNKALGELKTALGTGYKLTLAVSKSDAPGESTVGAKILKPVFPEGGDNYELKAPTVGDVLSSGESKSINTAAQGVAACAGALAKALKEGKEKGVSATFETKKRRMTAKLEGEGEEVAAAKAAIKSAVSNLNCSTFKLFKACANAQGEVNMVRALVVLVEGLMETVAKRLKQAGKDAAKDAIKSAFKLETSLSFSPEEFDFSFDFDIKINLPDFEGMKWTALLTPAAKSVWNTILAVKDKLIDTLPKFKELAEEVQKVIEEQPSKDDLKAEMEAKVQDDAMKIMKMMSQATGNLAVIGNCPKTIKVFIDTAQRVLTELEAGVAEVKSLLAASAA